MLIFFSLEIGPQGPYNVVGESQKIRTLWFQEMELVIEARDGGTAGEKHRLFILKNISWSCCLNPKVQEE